MPLKIRLQKLLSAREIASRRKAEDMIRAGRITCNGVVCRIGDTVDPEADLILVDGKKLPPKAEYIYLMLNKPRGYVTTMSDEKGRKTAAMLVSDCANRVYPIGRLDMDSEGLLLFTNDGAFANMLMHPRHEISKTYCVWVNGYSESGLERLQKPFVLDGYRTKAAKVKLLSQSEGNAKLLVTIHEGRNRQIRRMCEEAGMTVTRLQRIAEGQVKLGDLPLGKWRPLRTDEVTALKK